MQTLHEVANARSGTPMVSLTAEKNLIEFVPYPMSHNPRLKRELNTIAAMVWIYCRDHHWVGPEDAVCPDCSELLDYAEKRLNLCPFKQNKPTCGNCPIHCYKNEMRDKVRKIMRYSGPKMIRHHPILALSHLLDSWKKPEKDRSAGQAVKRRGAKHKQQ